MNLDCLRAQATLDAVMQARLALSDKRDPGVPLLVVRDQARQYRSLAHLSLLRTFPSVGVSKHIINRPLNRLPDTGPVRMGFFDVRLGAVVEVFYVVNKDFHDTLLYRQRGDGETIERAHRSRLRAKV